MTYPVNSRDPENPFNWYGLNPTLPVLFTGACQVRQVGVGDCVTTQGAYNSVYPALANPTANMTRANSHSTTRAVTLYQVTPQDIPNY